MERHTNIISAIESFTAWEQPWKFFSAVSASSNLSEAERADLEEIWEIAAGTETWAHCVGIEDGCAIAEAKLAARYPWLPASSLRQLVNGAAYQWR